MSLVTIDLSRMIPASPTEVYDAWLDPTSPGGPWFGGKRVILDVKVDGLFYALAEYAGRSWPHYGRFVKLERPRLIEYTWMSSSTKGLESVVTISLEPTASGTQLSLRHSGLPDDDEGRNHREGWSSSVDAVAKRFAR
jgi:uncharacterized protein YndB with AHSA1/START domain